MKRFRAAHPGSWSAPASLRRVGTELLASPPADGADRTSLLDVPLIEAEDVSAAVAWPVSDEARYVTGVALPVDAGMTLMQPAP